MWCSITHAVISFSLNSLMTFKTHICLSLVFANLPLIAQTRETPAAATSKIFPAHQMISTGRLDAAASLAAGYLERANLPDGRFVYEINLLTGKESRSYNIVRHAGAIYSLSTFNEVSRNHGIEAVIVRASAYLKNNYVAPGPLPGTLAVWSRPHNQTAATLGATALGIVALASARRIEPKIVSIPDLQALGKFMLELQRPDGSFIEKYRSTDGFNEEEEVLYYPGEAALGFLVLYDLDHSPLWLDAAARTLAYLCKSREVDSEVPADHWALIASAKLMQSCAHTHCLISSDELIEHATKICGSILGQQISAPGSANLAGGFDRSGRTTPTAIRIEGLCAALEFLPENDLTRQIRIALPSAVSFLLRAELTSGWYPGAMPGSAIPMSPATSFVRIDYVQHALSGWLSFERLDAR
jgi:hypothetical protein